MKKRKCAKCGASLTNEDLLKVRFMKDLGRLYLYLYVQIVSQDR